MLQVRLLGEVAAERDGEQVTLSPPTAGAQQAGAIIFQRYGFTAEDSVWMARALPYADRHTIRTSGLLSCAYRCTSYVATNGCSVSPYGPRRSGYPLLRAVLLELQSVTENGA